MRGERRMKDNDTSSTGPSTGKTSIKAGGTSGIHYLKAKRVANGENYVSVFADAGLDDLIEVQVPFNKLTALGWEEPE